MSVRTFTLDAVGQHTGPWVFTVYVYQIKHDGGVARFVRYQNGRDAAAYDGGAWSQSDDDWTIGRRVLDYEEHRIRGLSA
jgi:hypothetical protein